MCKNHPQDQNFSVGKFMSSLLPHIESMAGVDSFRVAKYSDPLPPRPPHPKQYAMGTDPELERMLHKLIAKAKACGAGP